MELDMLNLLDFKRVGKFDQKVNLRRYQRFLIDYFLRYTVQDKELDQDEDAVQQKSMALDSAIKSCKPEDSSIHDRRIYYEIVGKVYDEKDIDEISTIKDDSDEENPEKEKQRGASIVSAYEEFMDKAKNTTTE